MVMTTTSRVRLIIYISSLGPVSRSSPSPRFTTILFCFASTQSCSQARPGSLSSLSSRMPRLPHRMGSCIRRQLLRYARATIHRFLFQSLGVNTGEHGSFTTSRLHIPFIERYTFPNRRVICHQ